jgi:anthranilate phosphoribosyltransferase
MHLDELHRNKRERERLAASDRRIQIAKNMQLVGGSKIQELGKAIQIALEAGQPLPEITVRDAAMLIDAGVKIERLENGEATAREELTGAGGEPIKEELEVNHVLEPKDREFLKRLFRAGKI